MNRATGPFTNTTLSRGTREWYSGLPQASDPDWSTYFNDFLVAQDYDATDWAINTTEAGSGNASEAIAADERCGALLLTNDDANDDLDALQSAEEFVSLTAGKPVWFETRLKVSDADQMDLLVGLAITDSTVLDASDRVGFRLTDESASLACFTTKDSTTTTTSAVATLADATYVVLGFHYDGAGKVKFFVNRALVATHTTNIPDDENLALTIHIQNGEAAAKTCTVDYFFVTQKR